MLEKCNDLMDCEYILSGKIKDISLLGQIVLSDDDIQKLGNRISLWMTLDANGGTVLLWKKFPACLSCFLVWIGIRKYQAGDYWSSVHQIANLPEEQNLRGKWGRTFLKYLRWADLPTFADVGGLRYVTPILAHGGIPDYCLEDFFQHLLFPIVSGRLEVDVSDTEEIVQEWRERSSLFRFTDKPVRRFLLHGGEAAADFLSRCIEMAQRAYEESKIPTAEELGLPPRVIERFEEWWRSREDRRMERQLRSQFRRPVILLAPEFGEVYFNVPQQKIKTDTELTAVSIEIAAGQNKLTKQSIRAYRRSGLIETEEIQIPLHSPAEMYEVRFLGDSCPLRTWNFKGLSKEHPWMAFDRATKRMIQSEELPRVPVWLVFPKHCSIEPDVRPLEEGQSFYGRWAQYRTLLFDLSSVEELHLLDEGLRVKVPVASEAASEPELTGGEQISLVLCQDEPVYGVAPSLMIPISEQMHRWRLSIVPQGKTTLDDRMDYNFADLVAGRKNEAVFQIPLSDEHLLGAHAAGRFLVRLRGPLGKDRQFRFALLPNLQVEFDQAIYVPNLEKAPEAKLALTAELVENIIVEKPCQILEQRGSRWVVKVPGTESQVRCSATFSSPNGRTTDMPLVIRVPRLRLAIQGLNGQPTWQWAHTAQEISLEQWEESEEMFLLIDAPCEEGRATLAIQNTNQQVQQSIHRGKARFELKRFSDTLKTQGQPLSLFHLVLEWKDVSVQEIPVLAVRTEWIVEGLKQTEQVKDGRREIHLTWTDRGRVRNRIVRLWNLWRPWALPSRWDIPDGASEVLLEYPVSEFPPGDYRIEITFDDPWHGELPSGLSPEVNGKTIFDVSIGDMNEQESYRGCLKQTFIGNLEEIVVCRLKARQLGTYTIPGRDIVRDEIARCIVSEPLTSEELYALAGVLVDWISWSKSSKDDKKAAYRHAEALWEHVSKSGTDTSLPLWFLCELAKYARDRDEHVKDCAKRLPIILGFTQLSLQGCADWMLSLSDQTALWDLWSPLGLSVDLTNFHVSDEGLFIQRLLRTLGEQPLKEILHWHGQSAEDFEWPPACSGDFSECLLCRLGGVRQCDVDVRLNYNPDYYGGNEMESLNALIIENEDIQHILYSQEELEKEDIQQILDSLRLHPICLLHADAYIDAIVCWLLEMNASENLRADTFQWVKRFLSKFRNILKEISKQYALQPLANAVMKRLAARNQDPVCNVPFLVGTIALVQRLIAWGLYNTPESEKWKRLGIRAYQIAREIYEHDLCLFDVSLCIITHQTQISGGVES